jgi:cysteine desulfurase
VVTVATEHEAVLESAHFLERLGCPVSIVGVDAMGRVDPERVAAAVDSDTAVVSVMWANNETGVIQPVAGVAEAVHRVNPDVVVHTDAVQAAVSENVAGYGVDLLSIAAHKLGGPKGVGALVVPQGVALEPVLHGGGQELGRRSGTHNVAAAVGLATALELAVADRSRFRGVVSETRARFEETVIAKLEGVTVNAPLDARLVQHSHLRFPGIRNETVLIRLDQAGVAASAGSACQSGASSPSHVLTAMGMSSEEGRQCLRFTFGWTTTPEEGDRAALALIEAIG